MLPDDIFQRLPPPTILLVLSSLAQFTSAHVARQTPTAIPHRPLNVAAYPPIPAPTSPPLDGSALNELLRRGDTNTICGYIDGISSLPATCSAGSHCVVDAEHGVVGCCPNGESVCTAGIFTACVDANSGPQTVINPYAYTCTGSSVCYKNVFDGGYSQFGCGTASDLGATVALSPTGVGAGAGVSVPTESVALTEKPSTLSEPTTVGTATGTDSDTRTSSKDTTSRSSSTASSDLTTVLTISAPSTSASDSSSAKTTSTSATTTSGSSSSSSSATSTPTAAPAATSDNGGGVNRTGAIVGGSIAGVAALAGLIALAAFILRRRAGNTRRGPSPGPRPGDTQYISPMSRRGGSGGGAWTPLGQDPHGGDALGPKTVGGKTITHMTGESQGRNTVWQHGGVNNAGVAAGVGAGMAGAGAAYAYRGAYASPDSSSDDDNDELPLRYGSPEIDDFSRGFNDALSRIGEEDEESTEDGINAAGMSGQHNNGGSGGGAAAGTGDLADDSSRPLWLQSRRQSRNLMWT